jgi:hypothetical protein
MDQLYAEASSEIEKARLEIERAREVPLFVEDYEARLQEARTYLLKSEPAVHSVSITEMERFTRSAGSLGEEIQSEIAEEFTGVWFRRLGLVIFWFYLAVTIAIILRLRKSALARHS